MNEPYRLTVGNFHLDGYGHVNNARYLEFLEAARWHFFRQQNLLDGLRQARLVVAQIDIRYRRAAALDEELVIDTRIESVQSRQIRAAQEIRFAEGGAVCAAAQVVLMPTVADGRIFRLPETLFTALNRLMTS